MCPGQISGDTQVLQVMSLLDSGVSWNLVFSRDGCQKLGERCCIFVNIGGYPEGRGMKKDTPFHTMVGGREGLGGNQPKMCSFSPPCKKFPLQHEISTSRQTPVSCPTQHQVFISQASNPKPLDQYRHIEKQHWDKTIIKGTWANSPNRVEETLLSLANSWSNIYRFF